jgi:hypothetical protein
LRPLIAQFLRKNWDLYNAMYAVISIVELWVKSIVKENLYHKITKAILIVMQVD